jgi:HEAT repeat protein
MKTVSELEKVFHNLLSKSVKTPDEVKELSRIAQILELEYNKELIDIYIEFRSKGIKFENVWDMVNTKEKYPEAIDILVKYIPKEFHVKNREGIFRALTVIEARGKANSALLKEYNRIPNKYNHLRWVIGNAINTIVLKEDVPSILKIITDKANGSSRKRFVSALGKIGSLNKETEDVLIELLMDDEVAYDAIEALIKLKSKKAKDKLILLTNHLDKDIQRIAQRAISKIS